VSCSKEYVEKRFYTLTTSQKKMKEKCNWSRCNDRRLWKRLEGSPRSKKHCFRRQS